MDLHLKYYYYYCCMFEQKIKETTVQIYGSEARHIKANKSPQCNMPYICGIYLHSQKAWTKVGMISFILFLQLTFLWYENKECGRHECHYNYASPTQQISYCMSTSAICQILAQ